MPCWPPKVLGTSQMGPPTLYTTPPSVRPEEIPSSPAGWGLTVPFLTRPPSLLVPSALLALESGTPWVEDALPASPLLVFLHLLLCAPLLPVSPTQLTVLWAGVSGPAGPVSSC